MVVRSSGDLRSIKSHKVIFLGDQAVGKTSCITRFLYGAFDAHYQATIGIDFVSKVIQLDKDRSVKLQLWDTAGQERFKSLIPSYLRDTAACVVVYDISSKKSFESVQRWVEEARRERGEDGVVMVIVGNKSDLSENREVTQEEGKLLAEELGGLAHFEVSAKSGFNISELFTSVASKMPAGPTLSSLDGANDIQLDSNNVAKPEAGGCQC